MEFFEQLAAIVVNSVVAVLIPALVTWGFVLLRRKFKDQEALQDFFDILETAVMKTQDEVVRDLKDKSADGKLTSEEAHKATERALRIVKDESEKAGGEVKKFVLRKSDEVLRAKVKTMVGSLKKHELLD